MPVTEPDVVPVPGSVPHVPALTALTLPGRAPDRENAQPEPSQPIGCRSSPVICTTGCNLEAKACCYSYYCKLWDKDCLEKELLEFVF